MNFLEDKCIKIVNNKAIIVKQVDVIAANCGFPHFAENFVFFH